MRIGIAGFSIESCTFSPLVSSADDFQILRGEQLLESYAFLAQFKGIEFFPLLRARAIPGGPVDPDFYTKIKTEILTTLQENGPWDGIFLHMHGAVFVQGQQDAEGDLISAIRAVVGEQCLISASYDLHGNVSPRVMDNLDLLTAYRTAPHIDWYETLERACTLLVDCLKKGVRPHKTFIPVPLLLSGEQSSTEWEPAKSLYDLIPQVITETGILDASILIGYVWADEPRSTASVVAFGVDPDAVREAASRLAHHFWVLRGEFAFGVTAASVDECILTALETPNTP